MCRRFALRDVSTAKFDYRGITVFCKDDSIEVTHVYVTAVLVFDLCNRG